MSIGNTKANGTGSAYWQRVDEYGRALVQPAWTHVLESDTTLNDSDKTFTVPALKEWDIQSIYIEYTATATAGNRNLLIEIQDAASDVIMSVPNEESLMIASDVFYYNFYAIGTRADVFTYSAYSVIRTILPPLLLPAGYKIRIYDEAVIAAAADDMIVHIRVLQRDLFEEPA